MGAGGRAARRHRAHGGVLLRPAPVTEATPIRSPLQGTVVAILAEAGDVVERGSVLLLVESMKMHHDVVAPAAGRVDGWRVEVGSAVGVGDVLGAVGPSAAAAEPGSAG
ncbi:MAG: acetyl-CoA carboxylase biotin carboxyl carrier protein subunit, partial [Acidimicrobiia bacterium]|nr:acetyl-CoA carboxylase biotin carboxyl carrier protein subunit [Acidimicrobiia bacterium]